jgi:TusA-related sulfurtransferase
MRLQARSFVIGRSHITLNRTLNLNDNAAMEIAKEVDARGLHCPLPILKAKKALAELQSGQVLKVLCTDPGALRDFQAFAKQTGNDLVEQSTAGDITVHVLRRR